MMNRSPHDAPSYRHVAAVYDALASGYSLGAIDRAKAFHHSIVRERDRVLYAGAGRGREIVGALQRGAEVTCVEPCPAMAMRLHRRLSSAADGFTLVPRPIQAIEAEPSYDVVVAHYFLNVFSEHAMISVIDHLCRFAKPGGRLVIGDFKPGDKQAGLIGQAFRHLYYRPLNLAGWFLRICALHPVYDYAPLLIERGFSIETRQSFRTLPGLPPLYEVIIAQRV